MIRQWFLTRRVALTLAGAAILLVPVTASSAPPVPTVGYAHTWDCSSNCNAPGQIYGAMDFVGGLELDGGSRVGFWGFDYEGASQCEGCPYTFGPVPVTRGDGVGVPFPAGVGFDPVWPGDLLQVPPLGPKIDGSCSGYSSGIGTSVWHLRCSFVTPGGLTGTLRIVVTTVLDVTDLPCQALCEPAQAFASSEYFGVYLGRPVAS